ncbi:MAG: helix-turn-helix transcriptional regulator [Oscillospiraceae bacterium]|nr:helix-turn-helix transcriptional regulator [Oscillospiraceae bacterium]
MQILAALEGSDHCTEYLSQDEDCFLLLYFDAAFTFHQNETITAILPDSLLLRKQKALPAAKLLCSAARYVICFTMQPHLLPEEAARQEQLKLPMQKQLVVLKEDPAFIRNSIKQLCAMLVEAAQPTPPRKDCPDVVCTHLLYALLHQCSRIAVLRAEEEVFSANNARLIALRHEIYHAPARRWSIEEMCAQVSVSRTHLHRIYHDTFDVACHTDVLCSKLLYARYLLCHTAQSVREIAISCGFENDVTFMRAFKKQIGCTPTTFRQQAQHSSSECTSDTT